MILATDVQYHKNSVAFAAGGLFSEWESHSFSKTFACDAGKVPAYESGSFFKRELPAIIRLLKEIDTKPSAIIVDGYCTLGSTNRKGLGAHLFDVLGGAIPVIGVAKNRFKDQPKACELYRGKSKNPLFVTAAGFSLTDAKRNVALMHGAYRKPTLLKEVDRLCRCQIM
ncbi:MAG: endonuclease V [Paracoccaceae bacterium]